MSNEFDDATQLGSIGHIPRVPAQPQIPQMPQQRVPQQPAIPVQQPEEDTENTLLSTHGTVQPTFPPHMSGMPAANPVPRQPRQQAATAAAAIPVTTPSQPIQPAQPTQQPTQQPTRPTATRIPIQQPAQTPVTATPSVPARQADQTPAIPSMMPAPAEDIAEFHKRFSKLIGNVSQVVVGKEEPIRQCATAMVVGGHILLEDNPGTGKTQLARGLANSIDMSFKRIQFTPDLLPSDVVGVTYYDQKNGEFEYREGPIFASIVLADEINRASPKTQSALLEVMEEQKVTVDGVTHPVPQPFMVIATQNPIEQLGTYKLPEAQMDRFLIKTTIGYPSHDVSVNILKQVNVTDRAATVHPVLTGDDVLRMRAISETVHLDDSILEYIVRLVEATRHDERIQVGSSMRGALALTRCARVWAASDNRGYVVPDDVKNLAAPVLAHRITLTAEATFAGITPEHMIEQILEDVPAPTLGVNA